jgi:hypothetical protein
MNVCKIGPIGAAIPSRRVIEVTDSEFSKFSNDSTGEESDSVHLVSLTTMSGYKHKENRHEPRNRNHV